MPCAVNKLIGHNLHTHNTPRKGHVLCSLCLPIFMKVSTALCCCVVVRWSLDIVAMPLCLDNHCLSFIIIYVTRFSLSIVRSVSWKDASAQAKEVSPRAGNSASK
jgi:hypothetical protein